MLPHETHHIHHKRHPAHYVLYSLFTLAGILGFVFLFQRFHTAPSKAYYESVTFKIKLQGEGYLYETVRASVILYTSLGKVKEYNDILFSYRSDNTFEGTISFNSDFNYNAAYAVYIKPQKYFGKIFCNSYTFGKECTTPRFLFSRNGTYENLTRTFFSGGDIDPVNGRVDAQDISKLIANLGTSINTSTDINNDGITNTLDYNLALYSLGNNIYDDAFSLIVPWAPISSSGAPRPTSTPLPRPFASPTFPFPNITYPPTSTPIPSPTRRPTRIPTHTPTPTPTFKGVCQIIPEDYAKNTCDIAKYNVKSSTSYSACNIVRSFTPNCAGISLKQKCTCPTGEVCVCYLKNQVNQTVDCTNNGTFKIIRCN